MPKAYRDLDFIASTIGASNTDAGFQASAVPLVQCRSTQVKYMIFGFLTHCHTNRDLRTPLSLHCLILAGTPYVITWHSKLKLLAILSRIRQRTELHVGKGPIFDLAFRDRPTIARPTKCTARKENNAVGA